MQQQILDLLLELQATFKVAYLLITHNLGVVAYMAHRVMVLYQGRVVEHGLVADVLHSPQHEYTQALVAAVPTLQTVKG